jgi:hypothetical protein
MGLTIRNLAQSIRANKDWPGSKYVAEAFEKIEIAFNNLDSTASGKLKDLADQIISAPDVAAAVGSVANPTISSIDFRHLPAEVNNDKYFEVEVKYNPPDSSWGPGYGVDIYYAFPDTSGQGNFILDGSLTLGGSSALTGKFVPEYYGRVGYTGAASTEQTVYLRRMVPPKANQSLRVWLVPFSPTSGGVFSLASSPSISTTITPWSYNESGATVLGEEYAKSVTNFNVNISTAMVGAVQKLVIATTYTAPDDPRWRGIRLGYKLLGTNTITSLSGTFADGTSRHEIDDPATTTVIEVYAFSFSDKGTNTFAEGVTPHMGGIAVGTNGGVLDPTKLVAAQLAAHLGVTSGVFGVLPQAITNDLVANFAINQAKLANAPIIDAVRIVNAAVNNLHIDRASANKLAVVDADVVNLSANKLNVGTISSAISYLGTVTAGQITAGTLTSGVTYTGTLNASQVNAGTLNGIIVNLALNGITTTLGNTLDASFGDYVGVKVTNGTYYSAMTTFALRLIGSNGASSKVNITSSGDNGFVVLHGSTGGSGTATLAQQGSQAKLILANDSGAGNPVISVNGSTGISGTFNYQTPFGATATMTVVSGIITSIV